MKLKLSVTRIISCMNSELVNELVCKSNKTNLKTDNVYLELTSKLTLIYRVSGLIEDDIKKKFKK